MARIRTVKPEFWTSEQVTECSIPARLLFIGIWNFCDDAGRIGASAKQIKALVLPSDDIGSDDVRRMIDELEANGLVVRYAVDGKEYLQVTGWAHQKIDRPQPAKCPAPNGSFVDRSTNIRDGREGKGIEVQEIEPVGRANLDVRPKQVRTQYPLDFEDFWKAYPTDALMSKKKAAAEWKKLPSDKRAMALVSCPAFKAHCQANPDYRPVHACRYLSEERFVGFAATQERVADAGVHIMAGDPGWDEWQAVKKTPTDAKGGWWFPSKYPDETARMGRRAA